MLSPDPGMFTVGDILPELKSLLSSCEEDYLYRILTDAVEALANKGDFDPYLTTVRVRADGPVVALPHDVETVLGVLINGRPAIPIDRLFSYHINGPGEFMGTGIYANNPAFTFHRCKWRWQDQGEAAVGIQPKLPGGLVALSTQASDAGAFLTIYGFDENENRIGRLEAGVWIDGIRIPVSPGAVPPDPVPGAVKVKRILRVSKEPSAGVINLYSKQPDGTKPIIGVYQPFHKNPLFRQIVIDRAAEEVTIFYRRRRAVFKYPSDVIPLHSLLAVKFMVFALNQHYNLNVEAGMALEAQAQRFLSDEARRRGTNSEMPIQVSGDNNLLSAEDSMV